VVAAIVSWNYPFHNSFGPLISSLFAGNAIIIKVSELVVWSTKNYFEPMIHTLMDRHGLPRDLVQFVIGEGDIGKVLVTSGVDKITFIG
jgi:acyl-CoA reductase-like NAD-dependent aldehyde dehydrogenase